MWRRLLELRARADSSCRTGIQWCLLTLQGSSCRQGKESFDTHLGSKIRRGKQCLFQRSPMGNAPTRDGLDTSSAKTRRQCSSYRKDKWLALRLWLSSSCRRGTASVQLIRLGNTSRQRTVLDSTTLEDSSCHRGTRFVCMRPCSRIRPSISLPCSEMLQGSTRDQGCWGTSL